MLLKATIFLICSVAIATAAPVGEHDDEEEIPVYTEKVMPSSPTRAPKPDPLVSAAPKKSRAQPKPHSAVLFSLPEEEHEKRSPKSSEKPTYKPPLKKRTRDVKRERGPKHNLRGEYAVAQPVYAAVPAIPHGPPPQVVYDDAEPEPSYSEEHEPPVYSPGNPIRYVDEDVHPQRETERPVSRYIQAPPAGLPYQGYAAAPVQRYVPAPPPPQPKHYESEYVDDDYESVPQPYSFGYELKDADGASQSRQEVDDGYGNKKGSYGYTDGYGIYRQVEYVADKNGFRATIKTNEPGTANENPADVDIHSDASQQNIGY